MSSRAIKLRPSLSVHQSRYRLRKLAKRVVLCRIAGGFDEDRPAGAEPAQRIVEPGCRPDQLSGRSAVEIRSPEPRGALQAAILVQDRAIGHECRPGQDVGDALRFLAI